MQLNREKCNRQWWLVLCHVYVCLFQAASLCSLKEGRPSHSVIWGKHFITKERVIIYITVLSMAMICSLWMGPLGLSAVFHRNTHTHTHWTDMHSTHLRMYFSDIYLHAYSIWFKKPTKEADIIVLFNGCYYDFCWCYIWWGFLF